MNTINGAVRIASLVQFEEIPDISGHGLPTMVARLELKAATIFDAKLPRRIVEDSLAQQLMKLSPMQATMVRPALHIDVTVEAIKKLPKHRKMEILKALGL